MVAWILVNKAMVFAVLLGISEALGNIPSIKANSIFQTITGALVKLKEFALPAPKSQA